MTAPEPLTCTLITEVEVGDSLEYRGHVLLRVSLHGVAQPLNFLIEDKGAMKVAQLIVRNVGSRNKRIIIPGG